MYAQNTQIKIVDAQIMLHRLTDVYDATSVDGYCFDGNPAHPMCSIFDLICFDFVLFMVGMEEAP